ncbi:hypothetical protein [Saccharopolyspora pogona]|uniref:hypothetical protein n=1 Tax=Saccharopolyspora pogona TaxID=333966 RepID=UPI001CC24541|nr:hypothetical protein [Saccharopolyspora pogona]
MLDRRFHGGHDLSGGQWQRIAIARAFYRDRLSADRIYVLDRGSVVEQARTPSCCCATAATRSSTNCSPPPTAWSNRARRDGLSGT